MTGVFIRKNFLKGPHSSMFFFLRYHPEADYLHRLMWFTLRLLVVFLFPIAALVAQEEPSPTPVPEASPSPSPALSPAPEPAASPIETTPSSDPAPDAAAQPSPSAAASIAPSQDVIPLEGQPQPPDAVIGAPLETSDLAPPDQAMPDEAFVDPNAIVPDTLPPAAPAVAESAEEKARQESIRYRQIRIKVDKDPKIVSLLEQADAAKTEEDRRAAFREYYRLMFKKIVAIDSSLTQRCKVMEEAYLRRLAQERLEPTIPLNPPPTPEPLN
jgi:hypothetical protein